jgi:hypothetical protein
MPTSSLIRWSAPCFLLGALGFALFIFVSNGEFTGAALGLSAHHHFAHTAHFWSAYFFLFGITGFYAYVRERSGAFGLFAYLVAMTGTALFTGTGVITAFVWQRISANAPNLVDMSQGSFFNPPLPVIFIATVGFSVGQILLGVTALRTKMLPRGGALLVIAGAVLVLAPPPPWGPVPYWVIDAGAAAFLAGAAWLAAGIWKGAATA